MEVQSHAWVDCKDDNTTEIVNSEYVTTFDVETDGEKLGGGRGDASPHFSAWRDSIGIVPPPHTFQRGGQHRNCPSPTFSAQKNCGAYSLIHHSSLLKAATQD